MPIEIWWDDVANNIIRSKFTGLWTWDEYLQNNNRVRQMANTINGRVDMITDMSEHVRFPQGSSLRYIGDLRLNKPENLYLTMVVQPDRYAQMMLRVWNTVFDADGNPSLTSESIDAARAFILSTRQRETA